MRLRMRSIGRQRWPKASRSGRAAIVLLVTAAIVACSDGPVAVSDAVSGADLIRIGQEIWYTFRTVGPGAYASPPLQIGNAVRFLDETSPGPVNPGGPTQRFRYVGVSRGMTVIRFRHSGFGPAVDDTIFVR
jgi:hypothetical protein